MSTKGADLGQEAYQQGTDHSVVDLLHNLEGQPLHRLSEGTERDAGTALAIVELPTGEGLGLQVEMCSKSKTIHVFPEVTETPDGLRSEQLENRSLDSLNDLNGCHVREIAHENIMQPGAARAYLVVDVGSQRHPIALELHLERGGLDFFAVSV